MIDARRRFLATLAAGCAGTLLPACTPLPEPLRIACHVWPGYEFMFLARAQGNLPEERVQLVETPSATESLQVLAAGFIDGAALTLDEVLRARAGGVPLTVVAVFDVSAGADMLLAQPDIAQLADLKGKRIGVEHSGLGALMLAEVLKAANLAPVDVQIIYLAPNEQENTWRKQNIDAVICYEPTAGRLLAAGAHRLFDSRAIPDTIVDVLAIRPEALRDKNGAVRQLVAAHFQALSRWRAQPDAVNALLARRLGVVTTDVPAQFTGIELPDAAANRRLLGGGPPPLVATTQRLAQLMRSVKLLNGDDALRDIASADFLPTVQP